VLLELANLFEVRSNWQRRFVGQVFCQKQSGSSSRIKYLELDAAKSSAQFPQWDSRGLVHCETNEGSAIKWKKPSQESTIQLSIELRTVQL